jgi:shikimate kinase / 3-dehydroquinate synthase
MAEPNIVLTGFMGTGKTTIGRLIAERLDRPFLDLDDRIVERAGKSIPDIFAQDGEASFRALEAAACQEMRVPGGLVLATGGGAVVSEANREAMAAGGVLVCLDAGPETIVQRLAGQNGRPLLSGPDRSARVMALLAQRAGAYDAISLHLDTSHLSPAAAAERVMGMACNLPSGGHRIRLKIPGGHLAAKSATATTKYDILLAEGILDEAGARLVAAGLKPGRCAVVTNSTLRQPYAGRLAAALAAAGFDPQVFVVADGEAYKTLSTVSDLYDQFAAARLARNEPVIALGGGVIGDMAGFVAATWLRGVPFVQIPTSLLAMVDASVGGKVAVDLPAGKNLVGAFKQPALVLADPQVLGTLPGPEFRSGLAEILKAAIIGAPALFEQLAGDGPPSLVSMIADAVRVKVEVVERDPYEAGDRAWLNLGHTFGHALELFSNFTLRHGEAVALGMLAAADLSLRLNECEPTLPRRLRRTVQRLGLPARYKFDVDQVYELMSTDKKRAGRCLRFVIPRRIGKVALAEGVEAADVRAALRTICAA